MTETHQIEVFQETKEMLLIFLELLVSREPLTMILEEEVKLLMTRFKEVLGYVVNTVDLFVYLFKEITTIGNFKLNQWDYFILYVLFTYYQQLKQKEKN